MKGDKELRQWQRGTAEGRAAGGHGRPVTACGQNGFDLLTSGGWWGGRNSLEKRDFSKSRPHKSEAKARFYQVTLSSGGLSIRGTAVPLTSNRPAERWAVPCRRHTGWHRPAGGPCSNQLRQWAPSAGGNKDSAKCGELQVSATTCKSPTCGP